MTPDQQLQKEPFKSAFSLCSSPLGTFCEEECLRLSHRNSILMTQINVYIIIPVVIGFQMQICSILGFSRVPFDLCSLLPVNLKTIDKTMQLLHHPIRAYDWIPDRFYIISMEFLSLSRRGSSSWNISSREKRGDMAVFPGYCRNSMLIRPMAHT